MKIRIRNRRIRAARVTERSNWKKPLHYCRGSESPPKWHYTKNHCMVLTTSQRL
ncbi:MAG: hypothetical protein FWH27_05940 [Planctomycetaceae bacterium]|nr:hypothetical protein [Planctomycetaceae bacterium]